MNTDRKSLFAKISRLSFANKRLLLRAVSLAVLIHISLKIVSFKSVVKFISRFMISGKDADFSYNEIKKYHYLIVLTNELRQFTGINCLSTSIAFWFLLNGKGIKTDMQFGVKKDNGHFISHAWLEHKGVPLTSDHLVQKRYTVLTKTIL